MAWLWDSWEEYADYVRPICLDGPLGDIRRGYSWFEIEEDLLEAIGEIQKNLTPLYELGFPGKDNEPLPKDHSILDKAAGKVIDLTYAGEKLLLYHKRLAKSKASYEFLSSHDMYDHWEYYATTRKIFKEINGLVIGCEELINGYYEIIREDDKFLLRDLYLPKELEDDFILSRNLFSVGFDEVGVLIVGRGLEGVLRKIAKVKKINTVIRGKSTSTAETDFYDLIETMSRVKWKSSGIYLISKDTKALLHYLRALRNKEAHSGTIKKQTASNPREIAIIVTKTANQLWEDITNSRAKLESTTITKDW